MDNEILKKLKNFFVEFAAPEEYYLKVMPRLNNLDYSNIKKEVLKDIHKNWLNKNIDWFIIYLNKITYKNKIDLVKKMANVIDKYNLIFNFDILEAIMEKSFQVTKVLNEIFASYSKVDEEDINKLTNNETAKNILIILASSKNLYEEEIVDIKEVENDDTNYSDILQTYLKEIGSVPLFTPEEEKYYFKLYEENHDEKIKNKIIEANLRLVVSIAKRFMGNGLSLLDLIEEGNLGLIKAIDLFKVDKGYKFSTYATDWIKQYINREIANYSQTIRVSVHRVEQIKKINRFKTKYLQENGEEPSDEEICEELGLSQVTIENVNEILNMQPVSLNMKLLSEDAELGDFIEDDSMTMDDILINDEYKKIIQKMLDTLNPREKEIIELRFGLTGKAKTLEEIGQMLGITRERVRQIEFKAKRRMKDLAYRENLYIGPKHYYLSDRHNVVEKALHYKKIFDESTYNLAELKMIYGGSLKEYLDLFKILELPSFIKDALEKRLISERVALLFTKIYQEDMARKYLDLIINDEDEYRYFNREINYLSYTSLKGLTLREIFDCSDYEYNLLQRKCPQLFKRLTNVFGPNLDDIRTDNIMMSEEKTNCLVTLDLLQQKLQQLRYFEKPEFMVKINCTHKELELISKRIIEIPEKLYDVYVKVYGPSLTEIPDYKKINTEEARIYRNGFKTVRKKIDEYRQNELNPQNVKSIYSKKEEKVQKSVIKIIKEENNSPFITEKLNSEYDIIVDVISKERKSAQIIMKKAFGINLERKENTNILTVEERFVYPRLIKDLQIKCLNESKLVEIKLERVIKK